MPKSVTRSQALGSSAFKNDMVFPEQAPPWSHNADLCARRFLSAGRRRPLRAR